MIIAEKTSAHENQQQPPAALQTRAPWIFAIPTEPRRRLFFARMQPELKTAKPSRTWLPLFGLYALLTLVLVLPSASLWLRTPFDVVKSQLRLVLRGDPVFRWSPGEMKLLGRGVQTLLFLALGFRFLPSRDPTRRGDRENHARTFWVAVGALLAIHLAGLPWLNPDMFYPIGPGWVDAH